MRGSLPHALTPWRDPPRPVSMAEVAGENVLVAVVSATAIVALGACRAQVSSATSAAPAPAQPLKRPAAAVEQLRDWTLPKRPAPTTRNRNPFKFGNAASS